VVVIVSAAGIFCACASSALVDDRGSDASLVDAGDVADAGADVTSHDAASSTAPDAAPPSVDELLAPCSASRDVFFVHVESGITDLNGDYTYTQLGSDFRALGTNELSVQIDNGTIVGSVSIDTSSSGPSPLGTFPVRDEGSGPWLDLTVGDEVCSPLSGSFTNREEGFSDAGVLETALVAFDLTCSAGYTPGPYPLRGCLRFGAP